MNQQKVISREYKLVLKTGNFTYNESELLQKAAMFWINLQEVIKPIAGIIQSDIDIKSKREIRFYDTQDLTLQQKNYIFRERKNLLEDEREVTLKFRHPDRYISQDRDMTPQNPAKAEVKFEEDIKAPFLVLYSYSSTRPIKDKTEVKKLKHIVKLYPAFEEQLDESALEEQIILVNNLVIQEVVITGPEILINKDPLEKAECALIVWYDAENAGTGPIIAEFSFRYKNKKRNVPLTTAKKAYDLFLLIQQEMKHWIGDKDATKTGLVFGGT